MNFVEFAVSYLESFIDLNNAAINCEHCPLRKACRKHCEENPESEESCGEFLKRMLED